jgi:2-keto-4-pentenoate hydratase/2-oxohepta-3-ene-1,7-dioic acid hydratase in catechol pathway
VADGADLVRPAVSEQFDYEGEVVAVIGKAGRAIPEAQALSHVAGYTIFNDGSIRDVQMRTNQWTLGKNFDQTGSMGPDFVTADELPEGAAGLRISTRLNGTVLQDANTDQLIYSVATLVSKLSLGMTLQPGDLIVTGTPSGVGMARDPQVWMKPGDLCEVEVEGLGVLRNPVIAEG